MSYANKVFDVLYKCTRSEEQESCKGRICSAAESIQTYDGKDAAQGPCAVCLQFGSTDDKR